MSQHSWDCDGPEGPCTCIAFTVPHEPEVTLLEPSSVDTVALRAHLLGFHEAEPEAISRSLAYGWTLTEFHSKWHWYVESGDRWMPEPEFLTLWEDHGWPEPGVEYDGG